MQNLLLEIYCDELPAKEQEYAETNYKLIFTNFLIEKNITYNKIQSFSTPNRIVIVVTNLPQTIIVQEKEVKGPKVTATQNAIIGFCNKHNVKQESLVKTKIANELYWLYQTEKQEVQLHTVLQTTIPNLLSQHKWIKPIFANSKSGLLCARSIKNILCLLGESIVNFNYFHLQSTDYTFANKFYSYNTPIKIKNICHYYDVLKNGKVILNYHDRKYKIQNDAKLFLNKLSLDYSLDQDLLSDIPRYTEYPTIMLGEIDIQYLSLPTKLIEVVMKQHQRCFAIRNLKNELSKYFLFITNNLRSKKEHIASYHAMQVNGRLQDADFLFKKDLNKSHEQYKTELSQVVFHSKLGSQADQIKRLHKLSEIIIDLLKSRNSKNIPNIEDIKIAIEFSKSDLVSGIVDEFPEMRGKMSAYIASHNKLSTKICKYIELQYQNCTELNRQHPYLFLALLENINNLYGLFYIGEKCTSTYDRYGLRKYAINIIKILRNTELFDTISVEKLLECTSLLYSDCTTDVSTNILTFIRDRHINLLKKEKSNFIAAIFQPFQINEEDFEYNQYTVITLEQNLKTLNDIWENDRQILLNVISTFKRLTNILSQKHDYSIDDIKKRTKQSLSSQELQTFVNHINNLATAYTLQNKILTLSNIALEINCILDKFHIYDEKKQIISTERYNMLCIAFKAMIDTKINFKEMTNLINE